MNSEQIAAARKKYADFEGRYKELFGNTDRAQALYNEYGSDFAEWYLNAYQQLKGTEWESQMPGLWDTGFSPDFWTDLAEYFGDSSARQNFYNTRTSNAREAINSLLEAKRQKAQNDPAAQAQRLEAAGINSSLNPDNVSTGGSEVEQDLTPNAVPVAEHNPAGQELLSAILGTAETAVGLFTGGANLATAIEGFRHTKFMNSLDELGGITNAVPGMSQFLADLTPSIDWTDPASGEVVKAGTPLKAAQVSSYIDSLGLRPNSSRMLKHMLGRVRYDENGNPTTGYTAAYNKRKAEAVTEGQKAVEGMSQPGYSDNLAAWSATYNGLVGELNVKILEEQKKALLQLSKLQNAINSDANIEAAGEAAGQGYAEESAQSAFNAEYYNKLNPEAAAGASNQEAAQRKASALMQEYQARIDAAVLEHYANALQSIDDADMSDNEKWRLKAGIYEAQNQYMTQIMVRRQEQLTKAGKVMGQKDWYDFGVDVGSEVLDLIPTKGIGKMFGKLFSRGKKGKK